MNDLDLGHETQSFKVIESNKCNEAQKIKNLLEKTNFALCYNQMWLENITISLTAQLLPQQRAAR